MKETRQSAMLLTEREKQLLDALLEQGHITARQRARVEKTVLEGRELLDALHTTPLIDSLALARAQDYVRRSSGLIPKIMLAGAGTVESGPDSMNRDHDGVNVVDWGEMEVEDAPESAPLSESSEGQGSELTPVPDLSGLTQEHLEPFKPSQDLKSSAVPYDLEADEGIGIVRRANELLSIAIRNKRGGMQLVSDKDKAAFAFYNRSGSRITERAEDAESVVKIIAHLKVSARLSPWKLEDQQGLLSVESEGENCLVSVRTKRSGDADILTLGFS